METGSQQALRSGPAHPGPVTDLTWKGRVLSKQTVLGVYLGVSGIILLAGLAINNILTEGTWQEIQPVQSEFGSNPSYLTYTDYDLTTSAILFLSLALLGIGFVAAFQPRLRAGPFQQSVAAQFALIAFGLLDRSMGITASADVWLLLGVTWGFINLIWLLAAFVGNGPRMHHVRALGFILFGFYWATQSMRLYVAENGDFVNAIFAGFAVFFFNYFAYQELLSIRRNEDPRALHWLAGAAFLTTGLYVLTHKLKAVSEWLILTVAEQTTWLLQWFGQDVVRDGGVPDGSLIEYTNPGTLGPFPIQIILACTAVQSVMIFVGGILALRPPLRGDGLSGRPSHYEKLKPTYLTRRFYAFLLTVPLIYVLNLFRNVIIITMSATGDPVLFHDNPTLTEFTCSLTGDPDCRGSRAPAEAAFWFSHNIIGKGGSLLALIIIAFMVFQVLPELYDSIVGLLDLKDRRGPLERWWREDFRRGNGRKPVAAPPPDPLAAMAPTRET